MKNVNHRNYFVVEDAPVDTGVEKVVETVEEVEEIEEPLEITEEYLYSIDKGEQVEILLGLGFEKKDVNKLKYEKDRVEKILEVYNL